MPLKKFPGSRRLAALMLVGLAAGGAMADADGISVEGNTDNLHANKHVHYGNGSDSSSDPKLPCDARGEVVPGSVTATFSGNEHFDPGAALTLTLDSVEPGITFSDTDGTAPGNWNDSSDEHEFLFTTTVADTVPDGTYKIDVTLSGDGYTEKGPNVEDGPVSLTTTFNVIVHCDSGDVTPTPTYAAPSVAVDSPSVTVDEGQTATNSGTWSDADPGDVVSLDADHGTVVKDGNGPGTWTWSLGTDDGPSDGKTIRITATDTHTLSSYVDFALVVDNVAPVAAVSGPANALTGQPVTFTASATDVSGADTAAGFWYAWGSAFAFDTSLTRTATASTSVTPQTCGSLTVDAKAQDKDSGISAAASSAAVSVYDGGFRPPLDHPTAMNLVQKGSVVPVKITVGCAGVFNSGLTPKISLVPADAATLDDADLDLTLNVPTTVSKADTTGLMRLVDGQYLYNMQVPSAVGSQYAIVVRPFGTGSRLTTFVQTRK